MGIEKLTISRGHELPIEGAARAGKRTAEPGPAKPARAEAGRPVPLPSAHGLVHARLDALERLTRLFEQGALSAEEFAAEKATILRLPADERAFRDFAAGRRPPQGAAGPSLLGRLLNLKLLLAGLGVGIGVSYAVQPGETLNYLDQALRMIGV